VDATKRQSPNKVDEARGRSLLVVVLGGEALRWRNGSGSFLFLLSDRGGAKNLSLVAGARGYVSGQEKAGGWWDARRAV
jgi:hypothetical protein